MRRQSYVVSLSLLLVLVGAQSAFAYRAADPAWNKFWSAFSAAVAKRDQAALLRLMTPQFDTGAGESFPREEYLKSLNNAGWKGLQKSVATGTKPMARSRVCIVAFA